MAGPFDTYDIQFSQPLSKVDTNFYTQALFKKKEAYDQGFQQAQSMIDSVAGLPVANQKDKEYLQGKVNQLSSQINEMNLDFSDIKTINSIKSMSRSIAGDGTVQNILTSAANLKTAQEHYRKIKEKGGDEYHPANEDLFNDQVKKYMNAEKVGEIFDAKYIPGFDTFKYTIDKFNSINPDEQITETDDGYLYTTKTGVTQLDRNKVYSMVSGLVANDSKLATQLAIESRFNYKSYTPEELSANATAMLDAKTDLFTRAAEQYALSAATYKEGSPEKKAAQEAVDEMLNKYGRIAKTKEALAEQLKAGNLDYARNFIGKNSWIDSITDFIVNKAGSKNSTTLSESIQGKINREVQKELNKSESKEKSNNPFQGVTLSPTIPFGVDTENQKATPYNELDTQISQGKTELENSRNLTLYNNLPPEERDKFFDKPTQAFDAEGNKLPLVITVKSGQEAAYEKFLNDKRNEFLTDGVPNMSSELRDYFVSEQKKLKLLEEQAKAKIEIDQQTNKAFEKDVDYKRIENIQFPTSVIPTPGGNVKITKQDVISYAKVRQNITKIQNIIGGSVQAIENTPDFKNLLDSVGLKKEKYLLLNKSPRLDSQTGQPTYFGQALSQLEVIDFNGKSKEIEKYKDNLARQYSEAMDYGEKALVFGDDNSNPKNIANFINTAFAAVNQEKIGGKDYKEIGGILEKYPGDKIKELNLSYTERGGQPAIVVAEPGSKERRSFPIDRELAREYGFLSKAQPLADDMQLLKWRKTPTGISSTADGFADAGELGLYSVPGSAPSKDNKFQVKYKIVQKPSGYYLTVWEKPLTKEGEKINESEYLIDDKVGFSVSEKAFPDAEALQQALSAIMRRLQSGNAPQQQNSFNTNFNLQSFQ